MSVEKETSFVDEGFQDCDAAMPAVTELIEGDCNDITHAHQLNETKLLFTVNVLNMMVTGFILGYIPQYFYYWHTVKFYILLSHRWYQYKKWRHQYFLLDFCYFSNILLMVYLWFPWKPSGLFPVIFMFSNGPLLWAIVLWRNSLVPHSADKMTSLFVHLSPSMTTWAIRWHSLPDQGFSLCAANPSIVDGCSYVGWRELFLIPSIYYFCWMVVYVLIVMVWRKDHIEQMNYETSLRFFTRGTKQGFVYKLSRLFGDRHVKSFFFILQSLYTLASILSTYLSYHWKEYNMFLFTVMVAIACYNGATFYSDIIDKVAVSKKKSKSNY